MGLVRVRLVPFRSKRADFLAVGDGSTGSFGSEGTRVLDFGRGAGDQSAGGSICMRGVVGSHDRKRGLKGVEESGE